MNAPKDAVRWILVSSLLLSACFYFSTMRNVQRNFDFQERNEISATIQDQAVGCLVHPPMVVSGQHIANTSEQILEHEAAACGKLRRDWTTSPSVSRFAKMIERHQSDCTLPNANHILDNNFGLGSHIIQWSQSMCGAMQDSYRLRTLRSDWLWLDQQHCDVDQANQKSPMLCYFPNSEYRCPHIDNATISVNMTDPRHSKKKKLCTLIRENLALREFRAASTEYLFSKLSPIIVQEAQRQVGLVFGEKGIPKDVVAVHIRWGDKFWEMDLPKINEYIDAINTLIDNSTTANIYLATEDPRALSEFQEAKPEGWNVYCDITLKEMNDFRPARGNRASWATRNTKGRAGLVALGSLLVALEANMFVLTTKSNWSTLINQIRTNMVDPRCGNCTKMIDLRPGFW